MYFFFSLFLQGNPIDQIGQRRQYVYPGCVAILTLAILEWKLLVRSIPRRISEPDWTKPVCNLDGSYIGNTSVTRSFVPGVGALTKM